MLWEVQETTDTQQAHAHPQTKCGLIRLLHLYPVSDFDYVKIQPFFPCTFCREQSKLTY